MSLYLDASVVVALLTAEDASDRVEAQLAERTDLHISDWTHAEVLAALGAKARSGGVETAFAAQALSLFEEFAASVRRVRVETGDFARAGAFAFTSATPLRAGDALHLAVAARARLAVATLDKDQARAGAACGVETLLL